RGPGRGGLTGRRVLVVGAGQDDHGVTDPPVGNGRAMSVLFAREGAAVAVADIDDESAAVTAELVRGEGGASEPAVIAADAADEGSVSEMFARARLALGGLGGVVMNVGIGAGLGLRGTSVEGGDRVMAVNVRSHFLG